MNDGAIPQMPAGNFTYFEVKNGRVVDESKKVVDLTGLAAVAPTDPEPEYLDINSRNEAVVTLQENNHIVIIDLPTGKVTANFPAGTVDLDRIDTKKDGVIDLSGSMKAVPREPDTVQWIDDDRFVTANEGDWKGGSRGFTIFDKTGKVLFEIRPGAGAHRRAPRPLSRRSATRRASRWRARKSRPSAMTA